MVPMRNRTKEEIMRELYRGRPLHDRVPRESNPMMGLVYGIVVVVVVVWVVTS